MLAARGKEAEAMYIMKAREIEATFLAKEREAEAAYITKKREADGLTEMAKVCSASLHSHLSSDMAYQTLRDLRASVS